MEQIPSAGESKPVTSESTLSSPKAETDVQALKKPRVKRWGWRRLLLALCALLFLGELIFLISIWPDWDAIKRGQVPASALIANYQEQKAENPKLPRLQWKPLQKTLPSKIKKAFILSEDSRFYEHGGVDFQAIQDAIDYNWKHKKILLGASTISQQTAKNMFLSLSRNPLRKFHELFLTWLLEYKLSKAEILHVYLNVAEFGIGIYGIEAAARHYYSTSAYNLSLSQAAELAASLPSPKKHNPRTRTRFFTKHVARLSKTMQIADQYAAQQSKAGTSESALVSAELAKKLQELRDLNSEEGEAVTDSPVTPPLAETSELSAPAPLETTAGSPQLEVPPPVEDDSSPAVKETPEVKADENDESIILE